MSYLVLNGPNLNLLGEREPAVYGTATLQDVEADVLAHARERGVEVEFFQSNHEGTLVDVVQEARLRFEGIVINPGAYAHYSYALRDAIAAISIPVVEVHISDISAREGFRAESVTAPVCHAMVYGRGIAGYSEALDILIDAVGRR